MLFQTTTIISAVALLFASTASAAVMDTRAAAIATDPTYACNCPNNCSYKAGHQCAYLGGASSFHNHINGHCVQGPSGLYCQAD